MSDQTPTRVVNLKHHHYHVGIFRPTPWGNPFKVGRDGDRATVIAKYEAWIKTQPALLAQLPSLRGRVLGWLLQTASVPRRCAGATGGCVVSKKVFIEFEPRAPITYESNTDVVWFALAENGCGIAHGVASSLNWARYDAGLIDTSPRGDTGRQPTVVDACIRAGLDEVVLCEADDDDPEYIAAKVARELLV